MTPWQSTALERADAAFPESIRALRGGPPTLHVAGRLPDFARAVSIVGTRHASPEGCAFAQQLARDLAGDGVVVVSGGARGIDRAAHEGALEGGGATVAVLAGGLARPYPKTHIPLFKRIVDAGALLSAHPDETDARPAYFLARNQLIAALGILTVVVEAPSRSGALSTAAHAKALSKRVLAVPWAPCDERGVGCLRLIKEGALICTSSRDVLSVATLETRGESPKASCSVDKLSDFRGIDGDGRRVWQALGTRASHLDDIARRARLTVPQVQRSLLLLLLKGLVTEHGGGRYKRRLP